MHSRHIVADVRDGTHGGVRPRIAGIRSGLERGEVQVGLCADQRADQGHEQGRTHTLAGHVGDDDTQHGAARQGKRVVEVSGDLFSGTKTGSHLSEHVPSTHLVQGAGPVVQPQPPTSDQIHAVTHVALIDDRGARRYVNLLEEGSNLNKSFLRHVGEDADRFERAYYLCRGWHCLLPRIAITILDYYSFQKSPAVIFGMNK